MDGDQDYLLAHLGDDLANDPRVNELGLHVACRGERLFVTGAVSTEERRQAVTEVLRELAPGYEVHNETAVPPMGRPDDGEELS